MTGPRHPLVVERIVGELPLDSRSAIVIEQLENGKIIVWRCGRNSAGRSVLSTATRAFSVPFAALGGLSDILQRLENGAAAQPSNNRRVA